MSEQAPNIESFRGNGLLRYSKEKRMIISDHPRKPVAWRYQRKVGWGDVWRLAETDPMEPGFFESPDEWTVQPLFPAPPSRVQAVGE